jgi:hypothetical protein
MRTFRNYAIVAIAVMGLAASVPLLAQQAKTSDLLTNKQVKELVANAKTPADHVKLQKHFLAMAAKSEAEADEHAAEAQAYRKNPRLAHDLSWADHCERFAKLGREAAKEARDLASAHEHMAAAAK